MEERGISCLGGAPTFAEIDLCGVGAGVLETKLPFSEDIVWDFQYDEERLVRDGDLWDNRYESLEKTVLSIMAQTKLTDDKYS